MMKTIFLALGALCFSCGYSNDEQATHKRQTAPGAGVDIQELMFYSNGELDAVSAKYDIGRDTIRDIMAEFERIHYSPFSSDSARQLQRPGNIIAKGLSLRYQLPYTTVGNIIYDMKALMLINESSTNE